VRPLRVIGKRHTGYDISKQRRNENLSVRVENHSRSVDLTEFFVNTAVNRSPRRTAFVGSFLYLARFARGVTLIEPG
jgi:hypothetical protein